MDLLTVQVYDGTVVHHQSQRRGLDCGRIRNRERRTEVMGYALGGDGALLVAVTEPELAHPQGPRGVGEARCGPASTRSSSQR